MSFEALGLPKSLTSVLENANYKKPYPIQEEAIPEILKGKDVLGIAQTGSGKTASYVLPVLASLKVSEGKEKLDGHLNSDDFSARGNALRKK